MLTIDVSTRVSKNGSPSQGYTNIGRSLKSRGIVVPTLPFLRLQPTPGYALSFRRHFAWAANPGTGSGHYQSILAGLT